MSSHVLTLTESIISALKRLFAEADRQHGMFTIIDPSVLTDIPISDAKIQETQVRYIENLEDLSAENACLLAATQVYANRNEMPVAIEIQHAGKSHLMQISPSSKGVEINSASELKEVQKQEARQHDKRLGLRL